MLSNKKGGEKMDFKNEANRIVLLNENGNEVGVISFTLSGGSTWIADHTYVSNEYRGQGIAKQLVEQLVERARVEGKKIVPLCSYVKIAFNREPAYSDVMKEK